MFEVERMVSCRTTVRTLTQLRDSSLARGFRVRARPFPLKGVIRKQLKAGRLFDEFESQYNRSAGNLVFIRPVSGSPVTRGPARKRWKSSPFRCLRL
jgi:hypothetical protein